MNLMEIFEVAYKYRALFIEGTIGTLQLAFITVFFGMILGAVVAIFRMTKIKVLNIIAGIYVEIIRGTPLLVQLYIFYLFIPEMSPALKDLNLPVYFYIVLSLIIKSSAYVSEVIRAGIQAVDPGQKEAAKSLGMSNYNTMVRIIMPQAIKNILPALCNEFIMMIKETSLASTFFVNELMRTRIILQSTYFLSWQPLFVIAFIYFVLTYVLSKGVHLLERRLSVSD